MRALLAAFAAGIVFVGGLGTATAGHRHHRHCDHENVGASQDCDDLSIMWRLAVIGGTSERHRDMIATRLGVACGMMETSRGWLTWSNGLTAKWSNGSWQYPNGLTAKWSNGSWQYPNGLTAKWSNGSWQYPNGLTARWSNGSWQAPNGLSMSLDDLLYRACERDPRGCRTQLREIRELRGDERTIAIIGFVYDAWR